MADDIAKELAACERGLVVAPAGCGKTHLISEAVKYCKGRQLILTHTHAGVKAIHEKMLKLGVSADRYRISTIDSFALLYATAFPTISSWTNHRPKDNEWQHLRPAAKEVFSKKFAEEILHASYSGVFVDEYQDCTLGQHEIILQLASVLPCRVLGDHLQAIFWKINQKFGEALSWKQILENYPFVGELKTPHRWKNKDGETHKNENLGEWLSSIRDALESGEEIDLRDAPGVVVHECDSTSDHQVAVCKDSIKLDGTVIGMMKSRGDCHNLARELKSNEFGVFEDAQCEKLMTWALSIGEVEGSMRVQRLKGFVQNWLAEVPENVFSLFDIVIRNQRLEDCPSELLSLYKALVDVRNNASFKQVATLLECLNSTLPNQAFVSKEVWDGLQHAASMATSSLHDAAWDHRDGIRRKGRRPLTRCLSTPLLVKGLECDHSLILNALDFPDAESLYVCLTRASRSVTILAKSSKIPTRRAAS